LASAAARAVKREWIFCGLRMMKPSFTSLRTFCPAAGKAGGGGGAGRRGAIGGLQVQLLVLLHAWAGGCLSL
jgi:hypothetical protein